MTGTIYISWHLRQLYRLEQWLLQGFRPRHVSDSSGAWASVISQILKIRKQDKSLQKRLTVKDNRPGFSREHIPQLTRRF